MKEESQLSVLQTKALPLVSYYFSFIAGDVAGEGYEPQGVGAGNGGGGTTSCLALARIFRYRGHRARGAWVQKSLPLTI